MARNALTTLLLEHHPYVVVSFLCERTSDARMEPPIQALKRRSTVVLLAISFSLILCQSERHISEEDETHTGQVVILVTAAMCFRILKGLQEQGAEEGLTGGVFWESSLFSRSVKPWMSVFPPVTTTLPYRPWVQGEKGVSGEQVSQPTGTKVKPFLHVTTRYGRKWRDSEQCLLLCIKMALNFCELVLCKFNTIGVTSSAT